MPVPGNSRDIRPLFVSRPLLNQCDLLQWAKAEGFQDTIPAGDLHVTIALDREPVDWRLLPARDDNLHLRPRGRRRVRNFGGVAVLIFGCRDLSRRHTQFRRIGMGWDHPSYQPHVTFAISDDRDVSNLQPYAGRLLFGPEGYNEPFADFTQRFSLARSPSPVQESSCP